MLKMADQIRWFHLAFVRAKNVDAISNVQIDVVVFVDDDDDDDEQFSYSKNLWSRFLYLVYYYVNEDDVL